MTGEIFEAVDDLMIDNYGSSLFIRALGYLRAAIPSCNLVRFDVPSHLLHRSPQSPQNPFLAVPLQMQWLLLEWVVVSSHPLSPPFTQGSRNTWSLKIFKLLFSNVNWELNYLLFFVRFLLSSIVIHFQISTIFRDYGKGSTKICKPSKIAFKIEGAAKTSLE